MQVMKKEKKPRTSSTMLPLPFEYDPEPVPEKLTGMAGVTLLVQAYRSLGVPGSVMRNVQVKERQRGYDESELVESFVILNAVGGDCLSDFDRLGEDEGLPELIGHEVPSESVARKFLYAFHDEEKIRAAEQGCGPEEKAYIPEENEALKGLGRVNRELIGEIGRRCPNQKIGTVDQDASIYVSQKREAQWTYEGERGYQPMLAAWAEMNLILADEFRDGNVPAMMKPVTVARRAFEALPETVNEYYYRGDAASHEGELINWLRDQKREGGPKGFIGFAISARMTDALKEAVLAVPEEAWEAYGKSDPSGESRQCAEVEFISKQESLVPTFESLRYVAVRVKPRQGELFRDGSRVKHFAVVTNIWKWKAARLVAWHREKAGTMELLHDVLKNELAAGVLPCGRFGADAAWLRLAVISHNVMTGLKRLALPAELLAARPKRLRFLIFNTAGRLIEHARRRLLRVATLAERIAEWIEARGELPLPVG
jgi:hypothetical protein